MSKLLVDKTLVKFAGKKLLGRAHTSNAATLVNETIPSNVQMSTALTFGEAVPNTATKTFFTLTSGSVEYVEFEIDSISGTNYDEDDTAGFGGPESSDNTEHGYVLKLPSNYSTNSGNTTNRGTGVFISGQVLHESAGKLQLVPPYLSNAVSNPYYLALYDQSGARINDGDFVDWTIDYYNGVIFVQDPQTSKVPTKARGFLYIGKYADTVISEAGGGVSNIVDDTTPQLGGDLDVNGNDIVSVSDGNIKLLPNGAGKVIIDGNGTNSGVSIDNGAIHMRNGGNVSEIRMYCEVNNAHYVRLAAPPHANFSGNPDFVLPPTEGTNGQVLKTDGSGNTSWTDAVSFGRTAVTTTVTSSVSDKILGVSASAELDIRLPLASGFSAGQNFTIKDEAGNANTNNITIKTTGTDEIDGQSFIVLESPYAAVNIYCDGSSKFFIY